MELGRHKNGALIDNDTKSSTISGLTPNTEYNFRVAAVNGIGQGAYSANATKSTNALTVPGAPTISSNPTATLDSVSISWNKPNNGGATITSYSVQYVASGDANWITHQNGNDADNTALSATIYDLNYNTEYTFRVAAVNDVGQGAYSANETATTKVATVPNAPTQITNLDSTTNSVFIAWTNSSDDGGSAIIGYTVDYAVAPSGTWQTQDSTLVDNYTRTSTITGLTPNTEYNVRVAAINGIGQGAYSANATATTAASTVPVVPTVPAAPTISGSPTVTPDSVSISWNEPGNGGSPITDYSVQYVASGDANWTTHQDGNDADNTALSATIPDLNSNTEYTFRVAAVNTVGQGAYSANVTVVTSTASNTAPRITTINDHSLIENTAYSYDVQAVDDNADDVLEYYLKTNVASYLPQPTINSSNGTISWLTPVVGAHSFTIMVSDGTVNATESYTLTIAAVLVIKPLPLPFLNVVIGTPFEYNITAIAPADDPLTYSFTRATHDTLTINSTTGLITWSNPTFEGIHRFILNVTDGTYTSKKAITFIVKNSENTPPVIEPIPYLNVVFGTPFEYQVKVNNTDRDVLSYYIARTYNGLSIDQSGLITWPHPTFEGFHRFTLTVTDGIHTDTKILSFNVKKTVPAAPIISETPTPTLDSITISWNEPDNGGSDIIGYTVDYAVVPSGTWQTQDSALVNNLTKTSTITGLTPDTQYNFRVAAVNSIGQGAYSANATATTDAPTVPAAPTISPNPTVTPDSVSISWNEPGNGGSPITSYSVQYVASGDANWTTHQDGNDADNTALSATILNLNSNTEYTFRVAAVNDIGQGAYSANVTVVVPNPNTAPRITTITDHSLIEKTAYSYDVQAVDDDAGDVLEYYLKTNIASYHPQPTINSSNGTISWLTPVVGAHSFTIMVSDGTVNATESYTLTIDAVLVIKPLPLPFLNVVFGTPFEYNITAIAPGDDPLTYSFTRATYDTLTINSTTGLITWTNPTLNGTHRFTLNVTDGTYTSTKSITFIVKDSENTAPVIEPIPYLNVVVGTPFEYQVKVNNTDRDALTYYIARTYNGLSIDQSGLIVWPNPTFEGFHRFTLTVTDGIHTDTKILSFNVKANENIDLATYVISDNSTILRT